MFLRIVLLAVSLCLGSTSLVSADATQPYFTHHAVSTTNPQAQLLFDEGLTDVYAFNRQAAEGAFRGALAIDPKLAIAWWGVALARGPNINIRMSEDDMVSASQAIGKAKSLEANASREEAALIDALATRYGTGGDQVKYAAPYAVAMQKVAGAFPDDPDVEALYVDAMLDALWFKSPLRGMPSERDMQKRVAEDVRRWPEHIGLLHYFIHFTEPNRTPLALTVADRLAAFNFAPQESHLTHMPSHVYMYIGAWGKMSALNHEAVEMDLAQAKAAAIQPTHLDYFFHNLEFWYGSAVMAANANQADAAVAEWARYNQDAKWIAAARFGDISRATAIMDGAGISKKLASAAFRDVFYYGLVCAANGRASDAQGTIALLQRRFPDSAVRPLAIDIIKGRLAETNGDLVAARTLYGQAATTQDRLQFEDAPPWNFAPRELLAAMELRTGDAAAAVAAAEADLRKHPAGVPTLTILENSYMALGRMDDAAKARQEIDSQGVTQ